MSAHTPGPWFVHPEAHGGVEIWSGTLAAPDKYIADAACDNGVPDAEQLANGHLLAAAPDHMLVLYTLTCGLARWESNRGQLVVVQRYGEERYATTIDEFGCPKVSKVMRDALMRAAGLR